MYIPPFSSRVYGASYLLYFGALYMDVRLRETPPIARLGAHALHKALPLWHAMDHAVTASLYQTFSARSWEFFPRAIIKNQGWAHSLLNEIPGPSRHATRRGMNGSCNLHGWAQILSFEARCSRHLHTRS